MPPERPIRVGDLLTEAKLLRPDELGEAILIAQETGQMIGKVLIMSGFLSKENLKIALDAQSLLRDKQVDYQTALKAMIRAAHDCTSFEIGLTKVGWSASAEYRTAKLGEILVEAGVIMPMQMEKGLSLSRETGQPLGSCLLTLKLLTPELLLEALNLQAAVRESRMSRDAAVQSLTKFKLAS